jgi:hypothetical protein
MKSKDGRRSQSFGLKRYSQKRLWLREIKSFVSHQVMKRSFPLGMECLCHWKGNNTPAGTQFPEQALVKCISSLVDIYKRRCSCLGSMSLRDIPPAVGRDQCSSSLHGIRCTMLGLRRCSSLDNTRRKMFFHVKSCTPLPNSLCRLLRSQDRG